MKTTPSFLLLLFALIALQYAMPSVHAQGLRKVALVIGNAEYKTGGLANPVNDANSMKTALESLGFEVTKQLNRDKGQMEDDIDDIVGDLNKGDVCFVFYAGHGVSVGQANFLVPVGAKLTTKNHIQRRCVELDYLLGALEESRATMKVVVLDCCRDNPFRSITRSKAGGMAGVQPPDGTIVTFSTAPGQTALDGEGINSPFTESLVETIQGNHPRGLTMIRMFEQTARAVKKKTGQRGYMERDISMDDYFVIQPRGKSESSPVPSQTEPRKSLTNSIGMRFRRIPAGTFMMGSPKSETGRKDDEFQHEVTITKSFYMGTFEVTRGQFRQFVEDTGYKTEAETDGKGSRGWNDKINKLEGPATKYNWRSTGFNQTDAHPVVDVSWNDATKFSQWLSKKERKTYRLPTEAQWEYACRGGAKTAHHSGIDQELLTKFGNVCDATAKQKINRKEFLESSDGSVFTCPVGDYRPNNFGLYDMHGNVWEWCQDWYGKDYYKTSSLEDPRGNSGAYRVSRGGSWEDPASICRSAYRGWISPDVRYSNLGFRLVLVQE